jgi:hypothetical protein
MKFGLFSAIFIFLCACGDGRLRSTDTNPPGEHADVEVIKNGVTVSNVSYANVSGMNLFRCMKDHGDVYYLDGRTWLPDANGHLIQSTIRLFFPIVADSGVSTSVIWSGRSVQIYGRLHTPPYMSLGARLAGDCHANLLRRGSRLSGSILCRNFQGFDTNGIGTYDLEVSNLACSIR